MKSKIITISIIVITLLGVVFVPKGIRYIRAENLLEKGDMDVAYVLFEKNGKFFGSDKKCAEILLDKSQQSISENNFTEAYALLRDYSYIESVEEQINALKQEWPAISMLDVSVGEQVEFGNYEIDNNTENGKEPIQWIVVENRKGGMYLLSAKVLDTKPYGVQGYGYCSLKDWLNDTFIPEAFSDEERQCIKEIGLLSKAEVLYYGLDSTTLNTEFTVYGMAQQPEVDYTGSYNWWLNDVVNGGYGYSASIARTDYYSYDVNYTSSVENRNGVRPVIWLFNKIDPELEEGQTPLPTNPTFEKPAKPYDDTASESSSSKSSSSKSSSSKSVVKCLHCNGTGYVKYYAGKYDEGTIGICTSCNGTGKVIE